MRENGIEAFVRNKRARCLCLHGGDYTIEYIFLSEMIEYLYFRHRQTLFWFPMGLIFY